MIFARRASTLSKGEGVGFAPARRSAIAPISVAMPVAVTRQRARPATQNVPEKTVFSRSATAPVRTMQSRFFTGLDSPVSADSSHFMPSEERMRQSAGMRSPSSSSMTSPGTSSSAGSTRTRPPRTARAVAVESFLSFSRAESARYCCTTPTAALSTMMKSRMAVSVSSDLSPVT